MVLTQNIIYLVYNKLILLQQLNSSNIINVMYSETN